MSDLLVMLVFLPMAAGPFGFWMGLRYPKARDTFVLVVTVLDFPTLDLPTMAISTPVSTAGG